MDCTMKIIKRKVKMKVNSEKNIFDFSYIDMKTFITRKMIVLLALIQKLKYEIYYIHIFFIKKNYYRRHFGSSSYYSLYWDFFATPIALSKMALPTFQYPQCRSDTTTVVVLNEDGLSPAPIRTNRDVFVLAQEQHTIQLLASELTGLFWEADGLHDNESDCFFRLRKKCRNGWLE